MLQRGDLLGEALAVMHGAGVGELPLLGAAGSLGHLHREAAALAAPAADAGIDAARYYRDEVASRLEEMRSIIDRMEPLVGADYWPYPTYADILFSV